MVANFNDLPLEFTLESRFQVEVARPQDRLSECD